MFPTETLPYLSDQYPNFAHLHFHQTDSVVFSMPSSVYFQAPQRGNNSLREKGRTSNGLPVFSSAIQEKLHLQPHALSWTIPVSLPIPGVHNRRLRLLLPNISRFHQFSVARWGHTKGPFILCLAFFAMIFGVFALGKRFGTHNKQWPIGLSPGEQPTLVFRREDLQRIWKWEIASGHYPSAESSERRPISFRVAF
jgi:WD repeat and SOF domain-containing protein 1